MHPKSGKDILSRWETRFDDLANAKFGTFHESLRHFFVSFDEEPNLSPLTDKLKRVFVDPESYVIKVLADEMVGVIPENEIQAAAIGESFLRKIAAEKQPPRAIYDEIYFRDNQHSDRMPNQNDNDDRSLAAIKDRFLRPFRMFILENLSTAEELDVNPAHYDDGTGLLRKGVFNRDLESFGNEARREQSPLALVMIDLDNFKPINDKHGHPLGDEVLKAFSKIISNTVKGRGIAYRFGGDEFSVLLPNHTAIEAAGLAERIREAIAKDTLSSANLPITASIGVAELKNSSIDSAELLKDADDALLDAKRLGRNLVRISGEPAPSAEEPPKAAPPRKQPEQQGPYDPDNNQAIRRSYFQGGIARCPTDSAVLTVHAGHIAGRATQDLHIVCPMCGTSGLIQGPA